MRCRSRRIGFTEGHAITLRASRGPQQSEPLPFATRFVDLGMDLGVARTAMARQRHLTRAPIIEAIVDVRASLPAGIEVSRLESVKEAIQADLPVAETLRDVAWTPRGDAATASRPDGDESVRGFILRSEDGRRVAQFRRDGFAYHRLGPYPGWQPVVSEARRLLSAYLERVPEASMIRVSVRFVNRMDLRADERRLSARFAGLPAVPRGAPRELVDYVQRMVTRDARTGIVAIVQQMIERSVPSDAGALIFDVETCLERQAGFAIAEVERVLEQLRRVKNRIFFAFITDRTAKEYQ